MKSNICERRTSFDSDIYMFESFQQYTRLLHTFERLENIDNFKTDILFFDSKIIREQRLESNDEYFKE